MVNTPAGWYPQEDGQQRYWDGEKWTEHFAPTAQQPVTSPEVSAASPPPEQASARPWFKKKRFVIPAVLVGLVIVGFALGSLGGDTTTTASKATSSTAQSSATKPTATTGEPTAAATKAPSPAATAAPKPKPKPAEPTLTTAQENAKGSAESYLEMSGFSKKGLVEQLKFEGYETSDIEAAMATMEVDWNVEAAESAKSYLDMSSFSRSGLIEQLRFEGYTSKQATHGADSVGL